MDFQSLTNEQLIFIKTDWTSRNDVISQLVTALADNKIVTDRDAFFKAVMEREAHSETGMENGFAIPHGKSTVVQKPAVAIATIKKPLAQGEWPSVDPSNEVELVFLLAIPDSEKGTTHLKLLADLSTKLMDSNFVNHIKQAESAKEVLLLLENKNEATTTKTTTTNASLSDKHLIGVTACAAGIAHTYMAAEALKQAGDALNIPIHIEKQGANGIEDRITPEMIAKADGVIFATDIAVKDKERFAGLPFIQTKVAEPLRHGEQMVLRVLEKPDGKVAGTAEEAASQTKGSEKKNGFVSELTQAIMTGISYMIPVLVAGGLMIGVSQLGASFFGLSSDIGAAEMAKNSNQLIVLLHYFSLTGNMIMRFMYPIFTAFMAYSIADRPGLVSGFVGGAFAAGLHYTIWGVDGGIPSGFFGALILGAVAGYVSKYLNEHIRLHKNLQAMKPMFLIPGISVLAVFLLNIYLVDPVFGSLNQFLQDTIIRYKDSGNVILSTIIACLTAFDLGGPVNKAAGAIAIGLSADHIFPLTPRVMAIVIPPIGLGLATILDKYIVKRRVFDENLRVTGTTSLVLGFIAIGEGAIPFMMQNPLITIPINMIGASLGAVTGVLLGAVQWYPLPAIWGWPLVENFWAYAVGLIVGIMFIALANIFVRYYLIKRDEKKAGVTE